MLLFKLQKYDEEWQSLSGDAVNLAERSLLVVFLTFLKMMDIFALLFLAGQRVQETQSPLPGLLLCGDSQLELQGINWVSVAILLTWGRCNV